jgi:hypothetical protein
VTSQHHRWKFTALFVCLLIALLIRPFVLNESVGRWAYLAAMTFIFVAAIQSLSDEKWQRWVALGLGILCITFRWAIALHAPGAKFAFEVAGRVTEILFFCLVVTMLIVAIFRKRTVTFDNIVGAFAGYLLIALVWGVVYSLIELAHPGAFSVHDALKAEWVQPEHREGLLSYFSCCTLMTIGYGDITPLYPTARALAVLEGMTGQLYLAVLVAVLVGVRVAQATRTKDD